MKVSVQKSELKGVVNIHPSKSLMHRFIMASFLANSNINDISSESGDIIETIAAINSIVKNQDIHINESGTTLRLILPICAAKGFKKKIVLGTGLSLRPIDELIECLNLHGANIIKSNNEIVCNGKLTSGDFIIDASKSSQYVSGLLMVLPILKGNSTIKVVGNKVSTGYILITLDVINSFGIEIEKIEEGYFVKGEQIYNNYKWKIEGDWSSAATLLVAGVLSGSIIVKGISYPSKQGDSVIVDLLTKAGAKVLIHDNTVSVTKCELRPIEFDANNCIDLVPIMSVLASFTKGRTVIKNVSRLKLKESDRLNGIFNMLNKLNVPYEYINDELLIDGGECNPIVYDFSKDHRILMSEIICAMNLNSESIIDGVEGVAKSYPDFIEDLISIGGRIDVV